MKRIAAAALCCAVSPLPAGASAGHSWAQAQIKLVTERQLFPGTTATFRPGDPLSRSALALLVAALAGVEEPPVRDPDSPVSIEALDSALVRALGLGGAADRFYLAARAAGLDPPSRFGTEAVARLLGLRVNHPVGQEGLELQPQQAATRAEAAYSTAAILELAGGAVAGTPGDRPAAPHSAVAAVGAQPEQTGQGHGGGPTPRRQASAAVRTDFASSWQVESVQAEAQTFTLPPLDDWQRRILATAVSYIGYPYVWGGTGEGTPGFDCSGFVWRVYRLTAYPDEGGLAGTLRGRTTMEMSGEVPAGARIGLDRLLPGDVLFFGRGPRSKPAEVDHTGIYLGNGWFINSSQSGVAIAPLAGWHRSSFAWARRPLHEAGLT